MKIFNLGMVLTTIPFLDSSVYLCCRTYLYEGDAGFFYVSNIVGVKHVDNSKEKARAYNYALTGVDEVADSIIQLKLHLLLLPQMQLMQR